MGKEQVKYPHLAVVLDSRSIKRFILEVTDLNFSSRH